MSAGPARRLLLVGGGGGLLGSAVLSEFRPEYRVRSVHRHPAAGEGPEVEWVPADIAGSADWPRLVDGVDVIVNVAWYRWASPSRFRALREGLLRLLAAARAASVPRFIHVSVPDAPPGLESGLPYLAEKRRFDAALAESGLSFRIVRPTMLFGEGDRLLGVMLGLMHRYPIFPMFGDGEYHVSPIAVRDVARALRLEAEGGRTGTIDAGGPERFRYRDLTDLMFRLLDRRPRYLPLPRRASVALGRLVQSVGSDLLYAYEVTWLLSDRLGLAPYPALDRPLARVGPYLADQAARWRRGEPPPPPASARG